MLFNLLQHSGICAMKKSWIGLLSYNLLNVYTLSGNIFDLKKYFLTNAHVGNLFDFFMEFAYLKNQFFFDSLQFFLWPLYFLIFFIVSFGKLFILFTTLINLVVKCVVLLFFGLLSTIFLKFFLNQLIFCIVLPGIFNFMLYLYLETPVITGIQFLTLFNFGVFKINNFYFLYFDSFFFSYLYVIYFFFTKSYLFIYLLIVFKNFIYFFYSSFVTLLESGFYSIYIKISSLFDYYYVYWWQKNFDYWLFDFKYDLYSFYDREIAWVFVRLQDWLILDWYTFMIYDFRKVTQAFESWAGVFFYVFRVFKGFWLEISHALWVTLWCYFKYLLWYPYIYLEEICPFFYSFFQYIYFFMRSYCWFSGLAECFLASILFVVWFTLNYAIPPFFFIFNYAVLFYTFYPYAHLYYIRPFLYSIRDFWHNLVFFDFFYNVGIYFFEQGFTAVQIILQYTYKIALFSGIALFDLFFGLFGSLFLFVFPKFLIACCYVNYLMPFFIFLFIYFFKFCFQLNLVVMLSINFYTTKDFFITFLIVNNFLYLLFYFTTLVYSILLVFSMINFFRFHLLFYTQYFFNSLLSPLKGTKFYSTYFRLNYENLEYDWKNETVTSLAVLKQPSEVVDEYWVRWYQGSGLRDFKSFRWRKFSQLQTKNIFGLLPSRSRIVKSLYYYKFFKGHYYFYTYLDYFKHLRFTFKRIINLYDHVYINRYFFSFLHRTKFAKVLFIKTRYIPFNKKYKFYRTRNFFRKLYYREVVWRTAKPILNIEGDIFYKKKVFLYLDFPIASLIRFFFLVGLYYPILTLNFFRLIFYKLFFVYLFPMYSALLRKLKLYLICYLKSKR